MKLKVKNARISSPASDSEPASFILVTKKPVLFIKKVSVGEVFEVKDETGYNLMTEYADVLEIETTPSKTPERKQTESPENRMVQDSDRKTK